MTCDAMISHLPQQSPQTDHKYQDKRRLLCALIKLAMATKGIADRLSPFNIGGFILTTCTKCYASWKLIKSEHVEIVILLTFFLVVDLMGLSQQQ